jgi:Arc/MetJ-type ribon-helix-helix transcriptional regulator
MARSKEKVTVSVDPELIGWADDLVRQGAYESRSAAMEAALEALHRQRMDDQLEAALATLTPEDIAENMALAEMGVEDWFAQLDAEDGGWASAEVVDAAR